MNSTQDLAATLGRVGLPAPIRELSARRWDAVVVGGGHNGLAAAAYLARAGRSVLVLERREQLGGACTLERPFADQRYVVSPCAYVVGLLDRRVVSELQLERRGYRVFVCDPQLWCPLPDGSSFAQFVDPARTAAHMRENGFSERDIDGLRAYGDLFSRLRRQLRSGPRGDTWEGESPSRAELEGILGEDELVSVAFQESIAETLERYVADARLMHALFGQGVIGTFAGPRDPGTSSIHLMHHQGELLGHGGNWGYVQGGMGRVSFAIAQAAMDAGAVLAAGVPVSRIVPGEGVETESGDAFRAGCVIASTDPKRILRMVGAEAVPSEYRRRLETWRTESPVVKVNLAMRRFPRFTAANGIDPQRAMVSVAQGLDAGQEACEAARRGEPAIGFTELYSQTGYDPSVAPPGRHTMSAFAQYTPYTLAVGDWDTRRSEIGARVLEAIAAYAPDVEDCVEEMEVLGPPDIERRIGLTGGHIFQGEVLPEQMWDRRLSPRTPIEGLYLCGAATHPGGSVIGLNGRNAATAMLADAAS